MTDKYIYGSAQVSLTVCVIFRFSRSSHVTLHDIRSQFPGRPQPFRCSQMTSREEDCESKIEKFQALLDSYSLDLSELCQLSWSGVPIKVRSVTWRLLSGYLPVNLERRQALLESKRLNYWNLVKQYYDTDRDEAYQDTYRQVTIYFYHWLYFCIN